MIYLDNAATTMLDDRVYDAMVPWLNCGNPGSPHSLGRAAASAIQTARQQVANRICAKPEQIIFTSGGTEANALAILGSAEYLKSIGKTHIITTEIEHKSIHNAVKMLIKHGFDITYLPVEYNGEILREVLAKAVRPNTGLVSIQYVNNEMGAVNMPLFFRKICADNNILFHSDCVQALGCEPIHAESFECDLMSFSAHKIHGPKGVGALYVRDPSKLRAILAGGHEQEFGLRGGTENVAGIVGFGKACELCEEYDTREIVDELYMAFFGSLTRNLNARGVKKFMHPNRPIAYDSRRIISLRFDGIDAETLILALENSGVFVSAGAACNGHSSEPSYVLKALHLTDDEARSTIRVSFSRMNTEEEVEKAGEIIADCVKMLRSPITEPEETDEDSEE